jgi:hypothetical protein
MKKIISATSLFLLFMTFVNAQVTTPPAPINWKEKVISKWKYEGVETFGVLTPADSTEQKDMIELTIDGKYAQIEKGKSSTGTYSLNADAKTITFKDASNSKSKMYYLKKSEPNYLIIEFQTPNLIRTRYKFIKIQD